MKGVPESALCFTCHNGTGSNFDIHVQMNQDPSTNAMHPVNVILPGNPGNYTYNINTTAGIAPPGPYNCSQCHNPHGSSGSPWLLRGSYSIDEYVTYSTSPDPYSTCWRCHNSTMIVNDVTYFPKHNRHIVELQAPCTTCHYSPHGASHSELVKFNPMYVGASASAGAGPAFADAGANSGSCTLTCHGADHNNFSY